ncbi:MAG: GguC family protein [Gammaproteobacteria bacterium]|nr:GguC family protein [Gammaproteobacteria bacterium]
MRLVQFYTDSPERISVAVVNGDKLDVIAETEGTRELALQAIREGKTLDALVKDKGIAQSQDYDTVINEGRLLAPVTHRDSAHMLMTGTGLTHLGSASTRSSMHEKVDQNEEQLTDSMKMFKWGLEGGKPEENQEGTSPEWFYKGDGSWVVAPGAELELPQYALDGGEEPELVGVYVIADDGTPCRIGFALANEYSDHVLERRNYLLLAHSKLRTSCFGPELLVGDLPGDVQGSNRILRNGEVLWEKPFVSGEDNMSHSIDNLEHHHFKYARFRRPGDVHVHFFGTATISFSDQVQLEPGDVFEISAQGFGKPLRNTLARTLEDIVKVQQL